VGKDVPPRLAVWLVRLALGKKNFEAAGGDLIEEYSSGNHSAWWFWRQVLSGFAYRFRSSLPLSNGPQKRRARLVDSIITDLRYAVRTLRKTPTLTAAILTATALGIGVNAGIFSLMNALVLRPLPVKDAGRVVSIYQIFRHIQDRHVSGTHSLFSMTEYEEYRDHNRVLSGVAAYAPFAATMNSSGSARSVQGQLVSCNYFSVLGRAPVLGRDFSDQECRSPDASPQVILSHAFWQTRFGSDPAVLGRSLLVNRRHFTIIGIAPKNFPGTFVTATDLWAPITMQEALNPGQKELADPILSWLYLLGRVKPGTSVEQVRANLQVITKRIDQTQPGRETQVVVQVATLFSDPAERQGVLAVGSVVMLAVGMLLLIACANVANLLLARASGRQREIAIRLSVGATRRRLLQQLLTESVLLSLAGGALGTILSFWTFDAFYRWTFSILPADVHVLTLNLSPDVRVLGFSLALSLLTGIVFGLVPALQATRPDLNRVLKDEGRAAGRRSGGWLRGALLATQVAVCLVLLVGAGLISRGLIAAQALDPGFNLSNVVAASFDLRQQGYDEARAAHFYEQLTDRLRVQPGVQAVALSTVAPLSGSSWGNEGIVEGHSENIQLTLAAVSPHYFDLLDIPVVRGRGFRESDSSAHDKQLIVSESTARRFWPKSDPLGKRIRISGDKVYSEVIGVAKDIYATDLSQIDPIYIYLPLDPHTLDLRVLTRGRDAASLARQIRATANNLDQNVLVNISELKDNLKMWEAPSRVLVVLSSALGLMALLLAATGIFGVVNYVASRRTHEIGTRMALGANARNILGLVVFQSMRPVAIGAILGLTGAAAISKMLSSVLFGVSPLDPFTFAGMLLVLLAAALLATYLPAYRASRIDPSEALRHE
jgi:macrolide transport system ATP-binding/permease protein